MKFSLLKQLKSFRYALQGIWTFISTQPNAWIQLSVAAIVILAGFFFRINQGEWCWLLVCIGLVLSFEAMNTAVEFLSDVVQPGYHEGIRKVKDIAAGAVLIIAIISAIIGLIIFTPHILAMFG